MRTMTFRSLLIVAMIAQFAHGGLLLTAMCCPEDGVREAACVCCVGEPDCSPEENWERCGCDTPRLKPLEKATVHSRADTSLFVRPAQPALDLVRYVSTAAGILNEDLPPVKTSVTIVLRI